MRLYMAEDKPEPNPYSHPSYTPANLELGRELLDQCSDEKIAARLSDVVNLPQVDGALYGVYYGNCMEGYIRGDMFGSVLMMHPNTLKSIMRACCAIGFYTQESISRADKLWETPVNEKKEKRHYCLYCKTSSVIDINERICDKCKQETEEKPYY